MPSTAATGSDVAPAGTSSVSSVEGIGAFWACTFFKASSNFPVAVACISVALACMRRSSAGLTSLSPSAGGGGPSTAGGPSAPLACAILASDSSNFPDVVASRRVCFAAWRRDSAGSSAGAAAFLTDCNAISSLPLAVASRSAAFACCRNSSSLVSGAFLAFTFFSDSSNFPDDVASRSVCFTFARNSSLAGGGADFSVLMSAKVASKRPSTVASRRVLFANLRRSSSVWSVAGFLSMAGGGAGISGAAGFVTTPALFTSRSAMNAAGSLGISLMHSCIASFKRSSRLCSSKYFLAAFTLGLSSTGFIAALSSNLF
mmetsp:Transcript_126327/g.229361  ORF Transcript_126327/g.229361 Transcript_126327/m.229361 type:complete len:316 (+) Transcript_126327:347-1294(+)